MAFLTRSVAIWLALACVVCFPEIARAESSLRGARVVWVRGDRVYVASSDSVALEAGTILEFKNRGKVVATGEVTAVHDGELIAARLTSGSFKKVKHLEKLEVTAEPPVVRRLSLLRVGYPAAGRKNLLFDCSNQSLDSSLQVGPHGTSPGQHVYNAELSGNRIYRLVRDSTISVIPPWPDTLLVRLFDEIADEEIALERGDLDVGVFWPGEPSTHIRDVMGWNRHSRAGFRAKITATAWREGLTRDAIGLSDDEWKAIEALNHELFRDDLSLAQGWKKPSVLTAPGRFEVDPSLPGHEAIERFLNRAMGTSAPIDSARIVRLYYAEVWPNLAMLGGLPPESRLLVRCPVISDPKLRSYLDAISTNALANLFQCLPRAAKP